MKYLFFLLITLHIQLLWSLKDEAIIKAIPDLPITYSFHIETESREITPQGEKKPNGNAILDVNANVMLFTKGEIPELVITPGFLIAQLRVGPLYFKFDSQDPAYVDHFLTKKFKEDFGHMIRLPLSEEKKFLTKPSKEYPDLPISQNMLSLYLEMVHYFLTLLNPGQEYQVGFLGNFSEEEKNEPFDITIMVKNITDEYVETETALKWGSEKEDFIGTGRLQINHDRKNGLMKQMTGVLKYSMNKAIPIPGILPESRLELLTHFNVSSKPHQEVKSE